MNKKGFTLIELLVVIAIIGLLSTLAVVALGSAREKARDSKRLSDVKQVQNALELYYNDQNEYPTAAAPGITLGAAANACLNAATGFTTTGCTDAYMGLVPADPGADTDYTYLSADGSTYEITATLEGTAAGFDAGDITATPSGINQ
jgi:general secretion pathway protein G